MAFISGSRKTISSEAKKSLRFEGMKETQENLGRVLDAVTGKQMKEVMMRGALIARNTVRDLAPRGPTGNLKRAVTSRSVLYPSGVAAAIVGFRRAGRGRSKKTEGSVRVGADRAFHSHLIEFGTKPRKPLSMFGRKLQKTQAGREQRKALDAAGLGGTTKNDYGVLSSFKARGSLKPFFVTISPRGLRQVAGGPALQPMKRAFQSTASQVQANLEKELAKALERAVKENADLSSEYYGGA